MMFIEIGTQRRKIGRIEIKNLETVRRGRTKYSVQYVLANGIVIETYVWHRREEGAMRLISIVARKLQEELDEFFSLPADKVFEGAIKCMDIPKRYAKAFSKFSPVNTGIILGGELALWVTDIEGWLNMMKTGVKPEWD